MKVSTWSPLFSLPLIVLLSSCATSSYAPPKPRQVAAQNKVTVSVTPFAISAAHAGGANEAALRHFESNYFAVSLEKALSRTSGVSNAYFTPVYTPATDYSMSGTILGSDGKSTSVAVTLWDVNHHQVWTKQYSLSLGSGQFSGNHVDPGSAIWNGAANDFDRYLMSQKTSPSQAMASGRVTAYSDGVAKATDKTVTVAKKAATVERDGLLAPMTKQAEDQGRLMQALYTDWQREATKLQEERSAANASAAANMMLGMVQAAAAGMAQGTGDVGNAATLQEGAMTSMERSSNDSDRASQFEAQLGQLKFAVLTNAAPITVNFESKTYTLRGSKENQVRDFRRLVKQQLLKS